MRFPPRATPWSVARGARRRGVARLLLHMALAQLTDTTGSRPRRVQAVIQMCNTVALKFFRTAGDFKPLNAVVPNTAGDASSRKTQASTFVLLERKMCE